MPEPVRVNKPSRADPPSWVSRVRGLTCRRRASSWPLHDRGGWLVMMAVISSRRVDGWAGGVCCGRGGSGRASAPVLRAREASRFASQVKVRDSTRPKASNQDKTRIILMSPIHSMICYQTAYMLFIDDSSERRVR